jgi:hypothetical protein
MSLHKGLVGRNPDWAKMFITLEKINPSLKIYFDVACCYYWTDFSANKIRLLFFFYYAKINILNCSSLVKSVSHRLNSSNLLKGFKWSLIALFY